MAPPPESRAPLPPRVPARPAGRGRARGDHDRILRALVSLVDDLTPSATRRGCCARRSSTWWGRSTCAGGSALTSGEDGGLEESAEHHLAADPAAVRDLALAVARAGLPLVQELPGAGWLAATPLRARQRSLGVLVLHEAASHEPSLDREVLEVLGKQVGAALENVRLFAELRASSARAEVLRRITAAPPRGATSRRSCPPSPASCAPLHPFDRLACGFVNDTGDYIELVTYPPRAPGAWATSCPSWAAGPATWSSTTPGPAEGPAALSTASSRTCASSRRASARTSLLPAQRPRAQRSASSPSARRGPTPSTRRPCARLQPPRRPVALAFDNVRLFQKTRELSITDEVTPLFNFRFFHQIARPRAEARRTATAPGCRSLFVDLDRFKPINDQYGHLRGSRMPCARWASCCAPRCGRPTIPARYGGDEFVIILPQTDGAAARHARARSCAS